MANAVYDDQEQKTEQSDQKQPSRVASAEELERMTGIDGAEALRRAEEEQAGGEETKPKEPWEEEDESSQAEQEALEGRLRQSWSDAKKEDKAKGHNEGFFKGDSDSDESFMDRVRKRRKLLAGIGAGAGILLVTVGMLFSFLNIFKLDHIMSNLDLKTYRRLNSATDRRSDRWVRAYIQIRLARLQGNGADPDSEYFRSNKVDTNNPIRDWYRTLQLNGFENDLKKRGVVFANRDGPNGIIFSKLQVNGEEVAGLDASDLRKGRLVDMLNSGDLTIIDKLDINLSQPGGNKLARAEIKKVVKDIARDESVFKQRQLRKAFQNTLGIRSWRFFEKTRDKLNTKKQDFIRDKIVLKAVPETTKSGLLLSCLLGGTCRGEGDVGSSDEDVSRLGTTDPGKDVSELTKKILARANLFNGAVNVIQSLNTFSSVDKALSNGSLSSYVALSRGLQAMALYQVFETSRDQIKSGEITGDELNAFMQVIGTSAGSEVWTKVVNGQGSTDLTENADTKKYCSEEHQAEILKPENRVAASKEFAYLCSNKQIGGPSNAKTIEEDYNGTFGTVLHPLLSGWSSFFGTLSSLPGISQIGSVVNWVLEKFSGALRGLIGVLGFGDDLNSFILWVSTQMLAFLGGGPIINGPEPPGQYLNWVGQGAAFGAEASSRQLGAMLSNPASVASNATMVADYENANYQQMSVFEKYISLNNPESPGSNLAFAASNVSANSFGSIIGGIGHGFFGIISNFTSKAHAASDDSRRGANFAGIEMYDFPAKCTDSDPLSINKPSDGSNIGAVLGQPAADAFNQAGWDTATESVQWYTFLYKQSSDAKLLKTIYNCNLLDNAVRSGLGYLHGYTDDHGLDSNSAGSGTPTTPSGGSPTASINGYTWPVALSKADVSSGYPWPCPGNCHHDNTPAFDLANKATVADSTGAHDNLSTGVAEFAITDGKIANLHVYQGIAGCYSFHIVSSLDGYDYYYTHARNPVVHNDQLVKTGDKVAEIGERKCTGNGSYPHLHIDRGSPRGSGGGNECCRDPGFVDVINKLYAALQ